MTRPFVPTLLLAAALTACASDDATTAQAESGSAPATAAVEPAAESDAHAGISSPWERTPEEPDKSPGAFVAQVIGASEWVEITWHRPGLRGRDPWTATSESGRRVVPWAGDPTAWRAGANECTTIEFTAAVHVEGQPLAAGKYAVFMEPTDGDWTIIFQENPYSWASGRYLPERDTLRVKVTPRRMQDSDEWLTYGFEQLEPNGATAYMQWDKLRVPFGIELQTAQ